MSQGHQADSQATCVPRTSDWETGYRCPKDIGLGVRLQRCPKDIRLESGYIHCRCPKDTTLGLTLHRCPKDTRLGLMLHRCPKDIRLVVRPQVSQGHQTGSQATYTVGVPRTPDWD